MNNALICMLLWIPAIAQDGPNQPLFCTLDLDVGEVQEVCLQDGTNVSVTLKEVSETRDEVRSAVRSAAATVEIDGEGAVVNCGNYHLPMLVGKVQIDCPVTRGYVKDRRKGDEGGENVWGLAKDARLRVWPAESPLLAPGTFVYPVNQKWFASATQMANEPVFVDRGECEPAEKVYYHDGLDFGGVENAVEVVSATDGLVISAGKDALEGHDGPINPRYDVICVRDERNWYYRYSHLAQIDSSVRPGTRVRMGQTIGRLGKEGGSGGWAHLHFAIRSLQPSGQWGTQEAYAFVWEAYQRQYKPALIAVARPHHLAWTGQRVTLSGERSWSEGRIAHYRWLFGDGTRASGITVDRRYDRPGMYSEILQIEDEAGRTSYDIAVVQVIDRENRDRCIPTIHAAYYPTMGISPGDEVTFTVRTFGTTEGKEVWDFGDGSDSVEVQSDGNVNKLDPHGYAATRHAFEKPGDYLVKVQRSDAHGTMATARLHVRVSDTEAGENAGDR